jgi:RNA polymerase sigma-70 factor (ECF subfamily)
MHAMVRRYTTDEDRSVSILNDGFLRVFQKIESFNFNGSFEGWVRKLIFHSVSDHFRKEAKYLKTIVFESKDRDIQGSVLPELYIEDILKMVDTLPNATKDVFKLYALEGFPHKEIGNMLNISEGTSKWHLSEARKKLKAILIQNNYSYERAG